MLEKGLLASGAIPWVMAGITDIPGAPKKVYRDGGVTDNHMDIPFLNQLEGVVLFPHYSERIIPGRIRQAVKSPGLIFFRA